MKNIHFFISIILVAVFFSCKKQQDVMVKPDETNNYQPVDASKPITWEQLPDAFKNAVRLPSSTESQKDGATSRSISTIVETFGPYGSLTGAGFSIIPPSVGSVIAGVGIGHGDGTYVNTLIVWYKNANGTLYTYQAGVGSSFVFHSFDADEYIKGVKGRSSSFLNSLTIVTNKTSFTAGGTTGTYFERTALNGDWILNFRGRTDNTRITQIYFDVFCKPWELLAAGSGGRDIAVDLEGTSYLTNVNGRIYKMSRTANQWDIFEEGSGAVRIAANANRLCLINVNGSIYEWFAPKWFQMTGGGGKDIAINSDGKIWLVNSNGTIFRYNDVSKKWDVMPGSGGMRIAAGSGMVWLINTNGTIYKFNKSSNKWDVMPGSGGRDIAVGSDSSVWLTNVNGTIYNYNWKKSSWNELSGSAGSTIAANYNKAQLVNTSGRIYKLAY